MLAPNDDSERQYMRRCMQFASVNGLAPRCITFLPPTNDLGKIHSCLSESDVYVLVSSSEGSPLSILESMSCGTPWVATPVGEVSSMYGDSPSGLILENTDFTYEDFEEKVVKAGNITASTARSDWEKNFNPSDSHEKYMRLFTNILESNT